MKLLRILSCQKKITYLSAAKQTGIKFRLDMTKVQIKLLLSAKTLPWNFYTMPWNSNPKGMPKQIDGILN